jgi:hypothetical protein
LEEQKEDEQLQALNLISRISGIGPVFAKKLVYEEGVRTLQDIITKNIKLNHHQQIGSIQSPLFPLFLFFKFFF